MAKNMVQIQAMIEKAAINAMQQTNSNVKQVMVETGDQHVQQDVYNAYEPQRYQRTGELKKSFVTENEANGVSLDNVRVDGYRDVATVVETGEKYQFQGFGYSYEQPRPFMANTRRNLEDGRLVSALAKDLNSMGIKTK
ncbi:hypothetical protein SAMN05421503_1424 [Terribacillus aidingensis]|uniref:Phage protein, HK97 gp10 family n=1 Tax=Terribacillus aidingensis TaxID=586416 RepID=A0A285NQN2_9BACI|nr:hypothetical protein [Terribacillus aidingensis]SNZ09931.1 hypothetical protein SAMN05421503_1424 [Terribacillus aidingensis]